MYLFNRFWIDLSEQ